MSKKKLFWIAFFGLTLVEVGQMAYSHDKEISLIPDNYMVTEQCYSKVNVELTEKSNSIYGQRPIMLI